MTSFKYLISAIIMSIFIIAIGIIGYMTIEGWNFLDSAYMTIITLTTVGFKEVHPISPNGQIFTILLLYFGIGFIFYVLKAVVQFTVEGEIKTLLGRRKLDKKINHMKNHYIICGYGRIGKVIYNTLIKKISKIIVIDENIQAIEEMNKNNILYITGDAVDEDILEKANIKKAKGLIAALGSDANNVFLVLTAKQLNPDLFIMARASHQKGAKSKLLAAGATQVQSPYDIGAKNMAQSILRPTVTNFIELAVTDKTNEIQIEEIPINENSPFLNIMLKDSGIRQNFNLIIIAIKKPDNTMVFNPSFETTLRKNDIIIALGENSNLKKLEKALNQ